MGKKLELVLYPIEIEKYISELTSEDGKPAGSEEKRKARAALAHFVKMLKDNGRTWPEITDFEAFAANSKATANETTANDRRIRKFFAWFETERKNDTMTDNDVIDVEETAQPLDDSTSSENVQASEENEVEMTAPNESESLPECEAITENEPVKNKGGRRRYDTEKGEKRSVKFMVYFTPSVMAELKDLCSMKHTTCANYLFELACREIKRNEEALAFFREGMSKLI